MGWCWLLENVFCFSNGRNIELDLGSWVRITCCFQLLAFEMASGFLDEIRAQLITLRTHSLMPDFLGRTNQLVQIDNGIYWKRNVRRDV